eukprot:7374211-Prorocentrum_lima.AAC.1
MGLFFNDNSNQLQGVGAQGVQFVSPFAPPWPQLGWSSVLVVGSKALYGKTQATGSPMLFTFKQGNVRTQALMQMSPQQGLIGCFGVAYLV